MSTEFCQKCKQSHPGRPCDYSDEGECAETIEIAPAQAEPTASRGEGVVAQPQGSRTGRPAR